MQSSDLGPLASVHPKSKSRRIRDDDAPLACIVQCGSLIGFTGVNSASSSPLRAMTRVTRASTVVERVLLGRMLGLTGSSATATSRERVCLAP